MTENRKTKEDLLQEKAKVDDEVTRLKKVIEASNDWKNAQHIRKIRYVPPCRVMKAPELIGGAE